MDQTEPNKKDSHHIVNSQHEVDLKRVVQELINLEDEGDIKSSNRTSHRDNFQNFDAKLEHSKDHQPEGDDNVNIDDIHFSMSKAPQIDNESPFENNQSGISFVDETNKNKFQRKDLAEDTPRPSLVPPDQEDSREHRSNSILQSAPQFDSAGRNSSLIHLSGNLDEQSIEPVQLINKNAKPNKKKKNVLVCILVLFLLSLIAIGSLFFLMELEQEQPYDSSASLSDQKDQQVVFVQEESSFEQEQELMQALREDINSTSIIEPAIVQPPQNNQNESLQQNYQWQTNQTVDESWVQDNNQSIFDDQQIQSNLDQQNDSDIHQILRDPVVIEDLIPEGPDNIVFNYSDSNHESQINDETGSDFAIEQDEPMELSYQNQEFEQSILNDTDIVGQQNDEQAEELPICSSIIKNCQECQDESTCKVCKIGFSLHKGYCASWSEVCNAHDDRIATTEGCKFKKDIFGDHCQRVGTTTQKTSLQLVDVNGHPSTEYLQCLKCKVDYFISGSNDQCTKCSDKFERCLSCGYTGKSCQICERGSFYSNGRCQDCGIDRCLECSFKDHCTKCEDGLYFVGLLKKCYKFGDSLW